MTAWNGGYVADVEYTEGFYPLQSPSRMALACLLGNVAMDLPRPDDPVQYLELGCGRGLGALLLAASNPAWRVTAVDYSPTHIAIGSALAKTAGLDNIDFVEADLSNLAGSAAARAIPMADFVSMHGVWTWVGPDVRAGIVRLLNEKLRPGGAAHVSYNAMPAWQGALGLQRLIYEGGVRTLARSDRQAIAGLKLAREIKEADAVYLNEGTLPAKLLELTEELMPSYLSHEYMNAHWAPAFHADVAAAMAEAKLDWVASANPLENFPQLMLSEAQRAVFNRYDDPIMRELVKDICVPRQFRQDVYVRGARRIPNVERDARLRRLTLTPIITLGELKTEIEVPAGKAEMGKDLRTMMAGLMDGPATVEELLALVPGQSNPSELAGVLVGSMQGQIVVAPDAPQPEAAHRLNYALGSRVSTLTGHASSGGLACAPLATGLMTPNLIQFIAARLIRGETTDSAESWVDALSADVPPDARAKVAALVQSAIDTRVPILRQLGIVPG
jgi:SAM-dependent methyltransferase